MAQADEHPRKSPGCSMSQGNFYDIPVIKISHKFGSRSPSNKYNHLLEVSNLSWPT